MRDRKVIIVVGCLVALEYRDYRTLDAGMTDKLEGILKNAVVA
jgi:hypothetical protein